MNLNDVLSDKPLPARTEPTESATDVKPAETTTVETKPEPAASSAAQEKPKPAETEETAEQKAARERDDKGRFVKTVPHEALHAERTKRQALEQELNQLKSQQPPQKPTSVLDDEDKAFNERLSKATQPLMERFFRLSVKTARQGREDYEQVAAAFQEAAGNDPRLWEQFRASDDPGEYVYNVGKQIKELGDVGGDILKYGEKKRSEGAAEVEALKAQIKAKEAEIAALKESKERQDKIPQSLNGEQSATTRSGNFAGPTPLKSILS